MLRIRPMLRIGPMRGSGCSLEHLTGLDGDLDRPEEGLDVRIGSAQGCVC